MFIGEVDRTEVDQTAGRSGRAGEVGGRRDEGRSGAECRTAGAKTETFRARARCGRDEPRVGLDDAVVEQDIAA